MSQKFLSLRQMRPGMRLGFGVLAALFLAGAPALADAPAQANSTASLAFQMGERGEQIYDLALGKRWKEAAQTCAQIERLGAQLPTDGTRLRSRFALFEAIGHLRGAVKLRDCWGAAWAANRVTLSSARLSHGAPSAQTQPIPFEVTMLDVYARELQIAGGRGDEMAVYKALGNLRLNWHKVLPQLRNSDEQERALGARFDASLHAVCDGNDAKTMASQAPALLAQVDELEQIFARCKSKN